MRAVALILAALPAALGEGGPPAKPQNQLLAFVYNKVHYYERLAQFGDGSCHYYDGEASPAQLWSLEESFEKPGWYFLVNFHRGGHFGYAGTQGHGGHAACWSGFYADDQLWRFVPSAHFAGYYYVENYVHKTCGLVYPGGEGGASCGARHDDHLFKLVNVFQTTASWVKVDSMNNTLRETANYTFTWEEGYSETITQSVATTKGTTESLKESAGLSIKGLDLGAEKTEDVMNSVTDSQSRAMSKHFQATRTLEDWIPGGECWALWALRLDTVDASQSASFHLISGAYRLAYCDGEPIKRAAPLLV